MNASQQQTGMFENAKTLMHWIAVICHSMALTVEVFLHSHLGERAIGWPGLLAVPIILFFSMPFPGRDVTPLLYFIWAYIAMCGLSRIGTNYRRWRGRQRVHSRYTGKPRLQRLLPRCREITVKRLEPFLVFAVSVLVLAASEPLGAYLMAAAVALLISLNLSERYEHVRALDMNDAVIGQTQVAERFREMQGR